MEDKKYTFDQLIKISAAEYAIDKAEENGVQIVAIKKRLQLYPYVGFAYLFVVECTKDEFDNWIVDLM